MRDPADNVLVQVETFQEAGVKILATQNPWINKADKKFLNFQNFTGNLGTTVKYNKPPLFVGVESLNATFEGITQRYQEITVDHPFSVSYAYDTEQLIYNDMPAYMSQTGESAIKRFGNKIGSDVATLALTRTYRAFGDGLTPLNSQEQYAQLVTDFTDYGDPGGIMAFVNHVNVPPVIGSMANQFAPDRNDRVVQSWDMGSFAEADWYRSNLLATQFAGEAGDEQIELTITAVAPDGSTITVSGAGTTSDAAKQNDIIALDIDGAAGLLWLIFGQYITSSQKVQLNILADADSSGDSMTLSVYPPLVSQVDDPDDANQNINLSLADLVGVKCKILPSHKAGLITGQRSLFLAMPKMPNKFPWASSNKQDESGAFMRQYYGSVFDEDVYGFVNDGIYGFDLIWENSGRIVYPMPGNAAALLARKKRRAMLKLNPQLGSKRVKSVKGKKAEKLSGVQAPVPGQFLEKAAI